MYGAVISALHHSTLTTISSCFTFESSGSELRSRVTSMNFAIYQLIVELPGSQSCV